MSGARPDTWMPMFWGDYLRDTGHLDTVQHGAYLLLIGHYWTTGKPLPDDDKQLARIARLSGAQWKRIRAAIAAFFRIADGAWRHGRIEDELERAKTNVERRSKAGKKGAEIRWQPDAIATGNRIAAAPSGQRQNDGTSAPPSASPSEILKSSVDGLRASRARTGPNWEDPEVRKAKWVQKIIAHLYATRPDAEAANIVAAYTEGQQGGLIAFETADLEMRAAERKRGTR